MTKPFTTPFAADAPDNLFIPETAQPDGSVSYETGFGPDYSKDPLENGAKPIPRKGHNELFFQITGSIGDIQRQGAADWYPEFAADGGYPKNAIVWLDGDRWKSQIDGNTTRPNIDEISWLPSSKFEGGGGGGGGDFGLTGPTTIAVGGSFQYKISPYSSFMTYAVSATNGTATISGDTITLAIAPGETANVTDLTVIRSDGARNDFRIAIGAQSIAKPSMLSPASGSVDVPIGPLLTASVFMTYPDGADTHLDTDWRIRTMAGAVVWQSLANPTNKTNIQVPDNTLPLNTQLQADVRYRGATLPVSAWSDAVTFTTTNQSILTPTITAPLNGATGIGATPAFTATAFATNPLGADTHASSDWQLKNSLGVVIWSSVADVVNKTSITLPSGVLAVSSQYTMEVRYNGNVLQPSQWSPVVSFTTAATFAYEKYMAVSSGATPFVTMYGQDVDTLTKLATPTATPSSTYGVKFSPNGRHFAVSFASAPYLRLFQRSGDTFSAIANPAALPGTPSGRSSEISFSSTGAYFGLVSQSAPYLNIYKVEGDIFTKLAATTPSPLISIAFSHDDKFISLGRLGSSSPGIVLKRDGDSFSSAFVSSITNQVFSSSFSPNGVYLACATDRESRCLVVYKISGDTFTDITVPDVRGSGQCVAFSPDSNYVAIVGGAPYLTILKRSGDTFAVLPKPSAAPSRDTFGVAWSADGQYLAMAHAGSPYVSVYKKSGDTFTKIANPATLPPAGNSFGVAFYPPVLGI